MTKVQFYRKDGAFYGFRETGHHADFDYNIDDKEAIITVTCKSALPENGADSKVQFAASGLFEGYYYQLLDLTEEYYEFLSVEIVDQA